MPTNETNAAAGEQSGRVERRVMWSSDVRRIPDGIQHLAAVRVQIRATGSEYWEFAVVVLDEFGHITIDGEEWGWTLDQIDWIAPLDSEAEPPTT